MGPHPLGKWLCVVCKEKLEDYYLTTKLFLVFPGTEVDDASQPLAVWHGHVTEPQLAKCGEGGRAHHRQAWSTALLNHRVLLPWHISWELVSTAAGKPHAEEDRSW